MIPKEEKKIQQKEMTVWLEKQTDHDLTLKFCLGQREDLDTAADKIQYLNICREIPWRNIWFLHMSQWT